MKTHLHNFFIPHEGNNYHPRALHPKRVLFHAGGVLAVKALVILFMLAMPASAYLTPDVLLEQRDKIVELTNNLRRGLDVPQLKTNALLEQAAYLKAQDMLLAQYFAHVSPAKKRLSSFLADASYPYSVAGENLAMGFSSADAVVNAWIKSPTHYANLTDPEYTDIGVGLISGLFNNYDTTLVAQYFGAQFSAADFPPPQKKAAPTKPIPLPAAPSTSGATSTSSPQNALGETEEAPAPVPAAPSSLFLIDEAASKVYVTEEEAGGTAVRAEVRIIGATRAEVNFNNSRIELAQDPNDPGLWTGQTLIFEKDAKQIFNPVILPSVTATGADGEKITADISWDNIVPIEPSLTSQYFFMKNQEAGAARSLLTASSIYFTILLGLVIVSLALMIFIEIKKQHPKHIASGVGLIILLITAIIL